VPRSAASTLIFIFVFLFAALMAAAQDTPRYEAGGSFTTLSDGGKKNAGPGVTGVLNVGRFVSLEGTVNWFPDEAGFRGFITRTFTFTKSSALEGLFGVKAGYRNDKFGVFGKLRPGFISAPNAEVGAVDDLSGGGGGITIERFARRTEKVLDLGGVFEYYPARHWAVRTDLGSTVIFDEGINFSIILPPSPPPGLPTGGTFKKTTHHFQFSTGVNYRF
jgi:hypothetical protein